MKNSIVIISMIVFIFFSSFHVVSAGPLGWSVKAWKYLTTVKKTKKIKTVTKIRNPNNLTGMVLLSATALTGILAYYNLKQIPEMPVIPEMQEAQKSGATSYQSNVCDTPNGTVAVPKYFETCPNGTPVQKGPVIEFDKT